MRDIDQTLLKTQKIALVVLISATSIMPALFIQLDEQTVPLNIYKLLAKIGSLTAATLFAWQFIIGFRQAAAYIIKDLIWTVELHKKIGITACILILFHPVFITFYYLEKEGFNPLTLRIENSFDAFVMLGQAALLIIAIIFITSEFFRQKMSFDSWYFIHLGTYLLLPLALVHSFPIGSTVNNTFLRYIWIFMAAALLFIYLYRILCRLMLLSSRYKVTDTRTVGKDITEIRMLPENGSVEPAFSQFVYFRRGFWKMARPYTVSGFTPENGELSITAKASGITSTALQSISKGQETYMDGPYGVFAADMIECKRPVVMVAGGIGITPFRRVLKDPAQFNGRDYYLFYGNNTEEEAVYMDEFKHVDDKRIICVMSDQDDYQGEKGYITPELIKKYIKADLADHEFFICGPPVMTVKLEEQLRSAGVYAKNIHHELFDY